MKQKKIHEKYIYMKKKIKETKRQKRKRITKKINRDLTYSEI